MDKRNPDVIPVPTSRERLRLTSECLERNMNDEYQKYHYFECGLDNIYLSNGYEIHETAHGDAVSITDVDGLHRLIGMSLVDKPEPLTGAEFRFLRVELALSQEAIGEILGRNERQVRNWETSRKSVPEPANTIIRFVYKERFSPKGTLEEFSKAIADLQKADERLFELHLRKTDHGWEADQIMVGRLISVRRQ
jgi:DNA-binding transcriptional regulator YiaG